MEKPTTAKEEKLRVQREYWSLHRENYILKCVMTKETENLRLQRENESMRCEINKLGNARKLLESTMEKSTMTKEEERKLQKENFLLNRQNRELSYALRMEKGNLTLQSKNGSMKCEINQVRNARKSS